MADNVGSIYYTVEARTDALVMGERQASQSLDKLQQGFDKTDRAAENLGGGLTSLAGIIKTVIAASVLRDIASMVQGYQEMEDRIKLATRSTEEYRTVQDRLLATANGTYRSLTEAQELYILTSESLRGMGYSLSAAMDVQDSLSYAFVRNATSVDRANNAIQAFTSAMNKGKVEADGWASIMAAVPSVVSGIAQATGKTEQQIRALGAQGKLTAQQLTEGLRKSLEANTKAAADMTNNLRDAGVRVRTAFTQMFVGLETQTGVLDKLTKGIITAADGLLEFSKEGENLTSMLDIATTSGLILASVYGGRLISSVSAFAVEQYNALAATLARNKADTAAAAAGLRRAAIEKEVALAAVATAAAEAKATVNTNAHTFAQEALSQARLRATAATEAYAVAQQRANAVATAGTAIMGGLRSVMAFLGGPAGLIMLAATALLTFATNADATKVKVDALNASLDKLTMNQLTRAANEVQSSIDQINMSDLSNIRSQVNSLSKAFWESDEDFAKRSADLKAREDDVNGALAERKKRLAEINAEMDKRKAPAKSDAGAPTGGATPTRVTSEADQKALDALKDEAALAKLAGEERAKLAARQKLSADASKEEIAEAERLAVEIYRLEAAQKKLKDATKEANDEATKNKEKNAERIKELELEADLLGMTATEQELYKLQLQGATDEQIRSAATSLALVEAYEAQKKAAEDLAAAEQKKRDKFGDDSKDAQQYIRGNVTPLQGGEFDNQYARYEAEAKAEEERYAEQLDRLRVAQELRIEVLGGYQALEEQMAQEHADRIKQIEEAKNSLILSSGASFFDSMASMAKNFAGEQSGVYKAMFAVSKAFSLADAGLRLSSAIAQAMADPTALTPAQKFANMAAVAAAGANVVSQISSIAFTGKANGGPVQAGSMYRVNEGGAPEVFNAANGQQYMLPNQRGEVVSNKKASGGAGVVNHIQISVDSNGNVSTSGNSTSSEAMALAQSIRVVVVDELERQYRPNGLLWKMGNTNG